MITLHNAEVSTARGHLERGEGERTDVQTEKPMNTKINKAMCEFQTPCDAKGQESRDPTLLFYVGGKKAVFSFKQI